MKRMTDKEKNDSMKKRIEKMMERLNSSINRTTFPSGLRRTRDRRIGPGGGYVSERFIKCVRNG